MAKIAENSDYNIGLNQGCQMVNYFQTKNPNLGNFLGP
jgi:hypothetical protein